MNLYADSSALLKLFLNEPGTEQMAGATQGSSLVCVAIGYVELRAGLARAWGRGRISRDVLREHVFNAKQLWNGVASIPVDDSLIESAADNAELYGLRGYDALHLAALEAAGSPGTISFACWDRDLRDAAEKLGYDLLPQQP